MYVRQSVDVGGCVSVHVFGAVFGVAASRALSRHFPEATPKPSCSSQVASVIGESSAFFIREHVRGSYMIGRDFSLAPKFLSAVSLLLL